MRLLRWACRLVPVGLGKGEDKDESGLPPAPIARSQAPGPKAFPFPSLPTELRFIIWSETFQPRILHIATEYIASPPGPLPRGPTTHDHIRFKALERPPVALHICRESRALALEHYTPSFRSLIAPIERYSEINETAIYFNPKLDTVIAANERTLRSLFLIDHQTFCSIKTLVVGPHLSRRHLRTHVVWNLLKFASVETLIFVVDGEVGRNDAKLIWEDMRDNLVRVQKSQAAMQCNFEVVVEWKPPAVRVMNPQAFESQFLL